MEARGRSRYRRAGAGKSARVRHRRVAARLGIEVQDGLHRARWTARRYRRRRRRRRGGRGSGAGRAGRGLVCILSETCGRLGPRFEESGGGISTHTQALRLYKSSGSCDARFSLRKLLGGRERPDNNVLTGPQNF